MTTRIYTRTGDRGDTEHPAGGRVRKDSRAIRFLGDVDELGAHLGLARSFLQNVVEAERGPLDVLVRDIQTTLLALPGILFRDAPAEPLLAAVTRAESAIDDLSAALPPLHRFLIQSGHPAAAALHVARTVCRRAERTLAEHPNAASDDRFPAVLAYVNRLSDLLFVAARAVNSATGHGDETT